jgi:dolichol-phosphate mannosyltransferase
MQHSTALVVLPTYNERENIVMMVHSIMRLPSRFDVLVVDDGSPDGTADLVVTLQQEYTGRLFLEQRRGKQGLGTAYLHGFAWGLARDYSYFFEIDADFSHNPDDLERLLAPCRDHGYHMAIGSRYSNGVNVVNWPIQRVLLSYFASKYVKLITGMPVHDATAGFKCYRREALVAVLSKPVKFVGYAFQIEMKYKAWAEGFRILEVPIIFTDRMAGTSKMNGSIVAEAVWGVLWLASTRLFSKNR